MLKKIFSLFCIVVSFQTMAFAGDYKIHSTYTKGSDTWINVVLHGQVDREEIINMCKLLHKRLPTTYFHFFDAESKITAITSSDVHYPSSNYPYPESWANQHYIGMLNRTMQSDRTLSWQFTSMTSKYAYVGTIRFN